MELKERIEAIRDSCSSSEARINCELILEQMDEPGYLQRLIPRLRQTSSRKDMGELAEVASRLITALESA